MAESNECALNDKNVELSTLDRYKGRKDTTDRLGLVSKSLLRGNSHWFNNRSFRCLTTNVEQPALCCEKLGAPTQKFGLVVFHYVADHEGAIMQEEKCQGTLKFWVLSESKYQELSGVHKQWPLMDAGFGVAQHDLVIKCTEDQYQRMTMTPCPDAHWKKKEAWYKAIAARVERSKEKLAQSLGKKVTEAEVKEILGIQVNPGLPTQAPGDIDLSDILSGPAPVAQTGAVNSALDDDIPF